MQVLRVSLLSILVALGFGVWIFLHPATPPLRTEIAAPMSPIDGRAGIYDGDAGVKLVLPDIHDGYDLYTVDRAYFVRRLDGAVFGAGAQGDVFSVSNEDGEQHFQRRERQPYAVRAVRTTTDVPLDGWLFAPATPNGAGAVILHGSGNSDRANGWYVYLAHQLAEAGVTVILPDKRGSGRSGGDWRDASFSVLAEDGRAWLELLREAAPSASRVGFVGVSQGGTIAPLAARLSEADFAVALSSSATTLREQLDAEVANDVAAAGGVPGFLRKPVATAFAARARGRYPAFWRANGDFDMAAEWRRWGGSMFIAYGREDEHDNVPVSKSLARLERDYSGEANLSWRAFEGAGHALTGADHRFIPAFRDDLLTAVIGG